MSTKIQIPPPADIEAEIEEKQTEIKELRSLLRVSKRKHGVSEPEAAQVLEQPAVEPATLPVPPEPDPTPENGKRKVAPPR